MTPTRSTPPIVRIRLAELRATRGWTINKLADVAGISKATIIRLEARTTERIDFATIGRLAQAFDVAPGFLLTTEPEEPQPRAQREPTRRKRR